MHQPPDSHMRPDEKHIGDFFMLEIEIDPIAARRMAAEQRLIAESHITPWLRGERFSDGSCVYVERQRGEISITTTRNGPPLHFSAADAFSAELTWGGGWLAVAAPIAIAAIMGMAPDDVRSHLDHLECRRPMSILSMQNTLDSIRRPWSAVEPPSDWPSHGLARVLWDGPCDDTSAHWVATTRIDGKTWVFDYACMHVGGWVSADVWDEQVAPSLTKKIPGANGGWRITNAFEVRR